MREALTGLTTRGRAFIAAGLTAIFCAILLGQPALTRVGVLVLVLPLITAFWLGRCRYRLALVRNVNPGLVPAGQPAEVSLTLTNEGRTPSGVLLLEDEVPYALGSRPRFVLEGIGHGWKRHVTYLVRSEVRGRFELGPMSVRVTDPFGLVELGRAFHTTVPLIVTPRTVPLPPIAVTGGWSGSGDDRPRAFVSGSSEDVTVREYRRGDDLRRVHWRSSARVGELMVRREEQPWQARATVVIDNRAAAHRGEGIASSLESAVSTAASVAVHLSRRGFHVRLATADGIDADWHSRDADLDTSALLESLALLETSDQPRLSAGWLTEHTQGGVTVAVLGAITAADAPVLSRMRHHNTVALALALDVGAWVGGPGSPAVPVPLLARQGWRCVPFTPQSRLDAVWHELGGRGPAGTPAKSAAGAR